VTARSSCDEVRPELAELALGVLSGRERATVLAHVEGCASCEAELDQLSALADQVLEVAPDAEPPVGFETAVFDRLRAEAAPTPVPPAAAGASRDARGPAWLAVAAVVVALAFLGGWLADRAAHGRPGLSSAAAPVVTTADLIGARGPVGTVTAVAGSPGWLVMKVNAVVGSGQVACEVTVAGGATVHLGTFWVSAGYGQWSARLPVPASELRTARVLTASGAVVGQAVFTG
jgi:hypothetical protein